MRKISLLSLIFITLFLFTLADLSGSGVPTTNRALPQNDQSQVSNTSGAYVGTGSPLAVSFIGTFTNSSSWSKTTTTHSSDFTAGTSFSVQSRD